MRIPLEKGMRVRLTELGREHLGKWPRPKNKKTGGRSDLPWTGVVWRRPMGEKTVCVLLDGLRPASASSFYAGFWEHDVSAEAGVSPVLVVAGSHAQASGWAAENGLPSTAWRYAGDAHRFRGWLPSRVEYVGTYRARHDWDSLSYELKVLESRMQHAKTGR